MLHIAGGILLAWLAILFLRELDGIGILVVGIIALGVIALI